MALLICYSKSKAAKKMDLLCILRFYLGITVCVWGGGVVKVLKWKIGKKIITECSKVNLWNWCKKEKRL